MEDLSKVPCCVLGALKIVVRKKLGISLGETELEPVYRATWSVIHRRVGSVATWSDDTPEQEVLAKLREIANELEKSNV